MRTLAILAFIATSLPNIMAFIPTTPHQPVTTSNGRTSVSTSSRSSSPSARGGKGRSMMMMVTPDLMHSATELIAAANTDDVFVQHVGDYEWGTVTAPSWALPVGALVAASLGAWIPLALKPGVDAFNAGVNGQRLAKTNTDKPYVPKVLAATNNKGMGARK